MFKTFITLQIFSNSPLKVKIMKHKLSVSLFLCCLIFLCCKSVKNLQNENNAWYNISVSEDMKIFVDTSDIKRVGNSVYVTEKRIYTSSEGRKEYVDKIKKIYTNFDRAKKAERWNDFSYCIYHCLYDCTNQRFRVLSVEDYDSEGKLIVRTITSAKKVEWHNIESETVGDYTSRFVCGYAD